MAEEVICLCLMYSLAILFKRPQTREICARLERDGSIWLSFEDMKIKYTIQRIQDQLLLSREDVTALANLVIIILHFKIYFSPN